MKANKQLPLKCLLGHSAQDLFPDLFRNVSAPGEPHPIVVPPPPDTSWRADILSGKQQEQADDAPLALLAINGKPQRNLAEQELAMMGYAITKATSSERAIKQLSTRYYPLILCGANATFLAVRQFVNQLAVDRRRKTYFVLVGPELHTFYGLEALAFSANLVINDRDLSSLEQILKKGFREYEQLFRPLLDTLRASHFPG